MIKAVIFDLDDTLIPEKEYIKSGYEHISRIIENKLKINKKHVFDDLMGLLKVSPSNVFNRLYDMYHIKYSKEMIYDLVEKYREHPPIIQFYDDVIPCLIKLKELGIKLGIITDGYKVAQRQKLKAIKASKYFDDIIVTDELGLEYWKPNPKGFELIRETLKVNFEEMIYIGDNPIKDFYISHYYPIITVRILRNGIYQDFQYLEGIKENFRINNLKDLFYLQIF